MSLAHVAGGGLALHLGQLLCALALLVPCGVLTAARTPMPTRRDGTPLHGPSTRAALVADPLAGSAGFNAARPNVAGAPFRPQGTTQACRTRQARR
jgi:hypothetical protein